MIKEHCDIEPSSLMITHSKRVLGVSEDRLADEEPEPLAFSGLLGGEERGEETALDLLGHAGPAVLDRYRDGLSLGDNEHASSMGSGIATGNSEGPRPDQPSQDGLSEIANRHRGHEQPAGAEDPGYWVWPPPVALAMSFSAIAS